MKYDEQEFPAKLKMLKREEVETFLKGYPSVLVIREASQQAINLSEKKGIFGVVAVVSTQMPDGKIKHISYTAQNLKKRDLYKEFPHTMSIQDNIITPGDHLVHYLQDDEEEEDFEDNVLHKRYNPTVEGGKKKQSKKKKTKKNEGKKKSKK